MRVEPIDLRLFRDGSASDRLAVAGAFDHAARTVGFFSITGHGVDPALLDEMRIESTSNPPRYAPVTSGEHLLAKLMGPRLPRPSVQSPRH